MLDKSFFESLWKYDAIGVGVLFQSNPGKPMEISGPPISGSSGEKAGLRKGDQVLSINGNSLEGKTAIDLLDMMSNDEQLELKMEYQRPGEDKRTIVLARSLQKTLDPVSYSSQRLPDGRLAGYIKLTDFNSAAVPGMKIAIIALEKEGTMPQAHSPHSLTPKASLDSLYSIPLKCLSFLYHPGAEELVLDLRGNTGGGFQFALNIGGMFMDNRPMALAQGRLSPGGDANARQEFRTSYPSGSLTRTPLVVLIDELSASASEVLAGALHDNCRASLTGSNSFGKGKIQAVFGLQNGGGLTMTVAQYLTPKGSVIQSKGLQPDFLMNKPQANAYVNLLTGGILEKNIDLRTIDFSKAHEQLSACAALK
jgi:carboxyl-terminal processing protease